MLSQRFSLCAVAVLASCSVEEVTFSAGAPPVEDCAVAGDEDGNGQADCNDEACFSLAACQPVCTNGMVERGEECDAGSAATASCDVDCTRPACNDGLFNPAAGEEADPPRSASTAVPMSTRTCRYDFSAITQLYCAGTCGTWGGGNGCQQADADAFCRLKTGNPGSVATSFALAAAAAVPGICCPTLDAGTTGCTTLGTFLDRGVAQVVSVHETSLSSTHGSGQSITNVVCTTP